PGRARASAAARARRRRHCRNARRDRALGVALGRRVARAHRRRRDVSAGRTGACMMANPGDELVFAPLGGVGEIGMNLSIYGFGPERRRTWLAVDLGVAFGSEELLPGIDLIMPDVRFIAEERQNLVGIVLTHAHEDHF